MSKPIIGAVYYSKPWYIKFVDIEDDTFYYIFGENRNKLESKQQCREIDFDNWVKTARIYRQPIRERLKELREAN